MSIPALPAKYAAPLNAWYAHVDQVERLRAAAIARDEAPTVALAHCPFTDYTAGREVDAFLDDPKARLMVLSGRPGSGKSMGAAWGFYEAERRRKGQRGGLSKWLPAPFFANVGLQRREHLVDQARRPHLLVIDDLGQEHFDAQGRTQAAIDDLVRLRIDAELRTIVTTNAGAAVFGKRYGQRFLSRLAGSGRVQRSGKNVARWWINCPEPDMRGVKEPAIPPVPEEPEGEAMDFEEWAKRYPAEGAKVLKFKPFERRRGRGQKAVPDSKPLTARELEERRRLLLKQAGLDNDDGAA